MPETRQKCAARARASYTGEYFQAALAGVARDRSIGLDAGSPKQLELRALLALGFCNESEGFADEDDPGSWGLSSLSAYTITVSPRFDRTIFITDTPDNVVGYLLRMPGLRLEEQQEGGTYLMRHLPTGARLIVTGDHLGNPSGVKARYSWRKVNIDRPVSRTEQHKLAAVPNISADAQHLLAGVFCRMSVADPNKRWAIGNWFYDPFAPLPAGAFDPTVPQPYEPEHHRRLSGSGDSWHLEWGPYPYGDDLAAAMTLPVIGLANTEAAPDGGDIVLSHGSATLRLRPAWMRCPHAPTCSGAVRAFGVVMA